MDEFLVFWFLVSTPFREDLYSDPGSLDQQLQNIRFHPFQGRPLFGLDPEEMEVVKQIFAFPSLSGKTSIRTTAKICLTLYYIAYGFHPFQGRPLFGLLENCRQYGYPSGLFPSLSGKTSIRTNKLQKIRLSVRPLVSIPFREDLYSDKQRSESR